MINELEILAFKAVALKDAEYFTRKVCRYYSEKFHTPLAQVYELPWAFVFTNYIEHIIENNNNREQIYDLAVDIFYPEKKKVSNFMGEFEDEEQELQAWIKKIEKEAEEKRNKKKEIVVAKKEETPPEEVPEIKMESMQFEHLEEEMKEDE